MRWLWICPLLAVAAFLEVYGDSNLYDAFHKSARPLMAGIWGAFVLAGYGVAVNLAAYRNGSLTLSKLLGAYVIFFTVVAIVWDKCHNHQPITMPKVVGWLLIVIGGVVIQGGV
ncbi:MAG TPA: hypothetical protein VLC46_19530 [Thermoanaerobaculia bacterium]|jgi:hypothetical protein|nr:hypothetical protein [Thermoanaerobaculia bacterium]